MVHRIQNRNPGYSDFSNIDKSFNFQTPTNAPISDGATALKLEDEVHVSNEMSINENQYSENIDNESIEANDHVANEIAQETLVNETHDIEKQEIQESEPSNGLENFGLQEEGSFELFDNANEDQNTLAQEDKDTEEDELEIPAFLRRQKN